MTILTIAAFIH